MMVIRGPPFLVWSCQCSSRRASMRRRRLIVFVSDNSEQRQLRLFRLLRVVSAAARKNFHQNEGQHGVKTMRGSSSATRPNLLDPCHRKLQSHHVQRTQKFVQLHSPDLTVLRNDGLPFT